ncbi:trypsin-like serine protease with C-terminal PDZ domain [Desulfitobacterium dichloroeliminans LMG P-21439]|uniref:Trypsin-like serine protease with C-terminal PDZ domain n=1 Tax=Desulfitobacterium dichloroeliminans (strain LMG P-21439 / DCA1) TaxID=871963 RepID=L0FCD2_DESDL|nr:trypsin-like peptidase domain-containing protein [Desulfitobacterium dichloroeliminans]AGA70877.1 trypsin-like serine protease with C-terminal PDZ domain [Desulfitobacterium dichloroeliminans LMG P-21439]
MGYYDQNDYQNYPDKRQRPRFFSTIALALISAIIGGLISVALVPSLYGNQAPVPKEVILGQGSSTPPVSITNPTGFPVVEVAKTVGPAVVGIANFQSRGSIFGGTGLTEAGTGSGFIIDADYGYIVTNYHVIADASRLMVSLADGRNAEATLVGQDPRTDLAVIKIAPEKLTATQLGNSDQLQVGEPVVAIGNPGGEEFARSVTQGVVSAKNRILLIEGESSFNLIQTDAAINPGNSGGPLVNYNGQVVGINSAKNAEIGFEGMGFAIPITDAIPVIQQLIEKGYFSHPGLLVSIDTRYSPEWAAQKGWPAGAYVSDIDARGPAGQAGIQPGDILVKINGITVKSSLELTHELFKFKPGDTVTVTYFRNSKNTDVQVKLVEINP